MRALKVAPAYKLTLYVLGACRLTMCCPGRWQARLATPLNRPSSWHLHASGNSGTGEASLVSILLFPVYPPPPLADLAVHPRARAVASNQKPRGPIPSRAQFSNRHRFWHLVERVGGQEGSSRVERGRHWTTRGKHRAVLVLRTAEGPRLRSATKRNATQRNPNMLHCSASCFAYQEKSLPSLPALESTAHQQVHVHTIHTNLPPWFSDFLSPTTATPATCVLRLRPAFCVLHKTT